MDKKEIIESIANKGNGEIYLGVVGSVRTGKSTFIKKFIENLVIPYIEDPDEKKRCIDEIPQTASGKTIMTIEPKFIPSSGANINVSNFTTNIKLVDSVGFVTPMAKGHLDENGNPRMVKTPWFDEEVPFIEAASIGTEKVIKDHATIGILITTDGSFGELPRENFIDAESKVIEELKSIGKPFIIIMNTQNTKSVETKAIVENLKKRYEVPVISLNVLEMTEEETLEILKEALYEFPVDHIEVNIPDWISILDKNHPLKESYLNKIKECVTSVDKLRDVDNININLENADTINKAYISNVNTKDGTVTLTLESPNELYNNILKETAGVSIKSKADLLKLFMDYSDGKREYESFKEALKQVKQTGYGIAYPTLADMKLDKPEIIKQGNKYGVKLKAVASSIHMLKVDVESTFEPIIGSEMQSKELINSLMSETSKDEDIWKSEIFGRSLDVIVKEGIQAKLSMLPDNARYKLCQTITKMVNKGTNTLIAIVI